MNFENRIENFAITILNHRIKVVFSAIILIILISSGIRFLETPSGYRGFVQDDFKYYQDILELEEKYGNIDVLTYVIKPNNGDIFQKDVLKLIAELTEASWQTPYSSRVSSITNHQFTEVDGDDISIDNFIINVDGLTEENLSNLRELAKKEDSIVNFVMSESTNVGLININLEMPEDIAFKKPIDFAWNQKMIFEKKYPEIFVGVAGSAQFSHNFQSVAEADASKMYPGFLLLIIILTYLLLRSVMSSLIALLVIIFSILPSLGSAGWFGFEAQPPLIAAPIIILTISLAHAIHMLSIALTNMNEGMSKNDAIIDSLKINFTPIFLTSFTTGVGIAGLNFGDIPAYSEMANTVAVGAAFGFILSVTLLPALFSLLPIKSNYKESTMLFFLKKLASLIYKFKERFVIIISLICIYVFSLLPNLYFDDYFGSYFDRVPEWVEVKDIVDPEFGSSFFTFADIETNEPNGITNPEYLNKLDEFEKWLVQQESVADVSTVSDVVKNLHKNMNGGLEEYYKIPDNKALIAQYFLMYEFSVPYGMDLKNQMTADKSSSRMLIRTNYSTAIETVAFNKEVNLWIENNLKPFKTKGVAGIPIMMPHLFTENTNGLLLGLLFSFSFIILVVGLSLRSLRYGIISVIPNVVPFILGFGILTLFTDMVTASHQVAVLISIGLVVDATIHFLSKYQKAISMKLKADEAIQYCFKYVGYPIIIASICLFSGFIFLTQSLFFNNFVIGGMCAIIIIIALLIDLLLLPALLLIFGKKA